MEDFGDFWHWTKHIAGIVLLVLLSLYLIHSAAKLHLMSLAEFELFINRIVKVILA